MFRATKIVGYIRAMERRGIRADRLLARTRIDPKLVSSAGYTISLEQYHAVVTNMMKLTGDPGIAFSLGETVNLNDFGIYGYAMISANSVRGALDVMHKFASPLTGTQLHVDKFYDMARGYEVVFSSQPAISELLRRFEAEETIATGIHIIRELTGVTPVFGEISFAYPEPPHRALYERILKYPLEFDAPRTVIRILKPNLDTPIRTMNEELFSICAEHCHQVMRSLSDVDLLSSRLRHLFLKTPGRLPSLEEAAAALGLSASTLSRHLNGLGQSYQSVKNEFRFSLATEYLRDGRMPPKQVGYLLGFTDQSNFYRAFKAWTGQTVGQFLKTEDSRSKTPTIRTRHH